MQDSVTVCENTMNFQCREVMNILSSNGLYLHNVFDLLLSLLWYSGSTDSSNTGWVKSKTEIMAPVASRMVSVHNLRKRAGLVSPVPVKRD